MNRQPQNPFRTEDLVAFLEQMAGVQFIDGKTQRPVLDLLKEAKCQRKSDFELWLEQQDQVVQLEHQMGEVL